MLDKTWIGATVSEGTMRPEDLIPKFCNVLAETEPIKAQQILDYWETLTPMLDQDEEAGWILQDLDYALNHNAPTGTYFGAHPGDGSLYGFWSAEEDE